VPRLPALEPRESAGWRDPLLRTIAVQPSLAASVHEHSRHVMEHGSVPELTKELCAVLVAGLNFCHPSVIAHRRRARILGASTDMVNAIWEYAHSDHFTPAQKAALACAVSLTREARALPDALWDDMRNHYDDAQIVELLCAIGLANYLDRVSNALQTQMRG
jgi:AhpD family alkylhydroperoxidase